MNYCLFVISWVGAMATACWFFWVTMSTIWSSEEIRELREELARLRGEK